MGPLLSAGVIKKDRLMPSQNIHWVHKEFNVFAVELSAHCNSRCAWCPQPSMKRPKGHMSLSTLLKVVDQLKLMRQKYVVAHHGGESLLNPNFGECLQLIHGAGIQYELSTNGRLLADATDEYLQHFMQAPPKRLRIAIDYWLRHDSNFLFVMAPAVRSLATALPDTEIYLHTLFLETNIDVLNTMFNVHKYSNVKIHVKDFDNWAGQVGGKSTLVGSKCFFKQYRYVNVLWTGEIVPCCIDIVGKHVIGHIDTGVRFADDYALCDTCVGMGVPLGAEQDFGLQV